jgi:alpha-L-fucosidase
MTESTRHRSCITEGRSLIRLAVALLHLLVVVGCSNATAEQAGPTPDTDQRMKWWREARFGMFIHWGLYAVPAGQWKDKTDHGEWIMNTAEIPVEQYEKFAGQFNPVKFNAAEWVNIARHAGMKYIVITSKHHDGFCLFDSKLTTYDVMDATPFKKDILSELADECRRQGITMCWYHSIMDWHHPDYIPRRPWEKRSAEGADYNRYIDYMLGQLRELVTNYGRIGVLWFDGGWEHNAQQHRSEEVVAMLRAIQSNIIINNRIGLPLDFDTPEQTIPATGIPGRDWETCMTMNGHWGYCRADENWKSTEDLLRKLADIASKGGNFLLNVGPTAEGLIPGPSIERLAAMGEWMKVNGQSIYGTTASPFRRLPWGRCTAKPGTLYLHVFDWPQNGRLEVPGLKNKVIKAYLLADEKQRALAVTREDEENLVISVGDRAPDPINSVVVLKIAGKPDVVPYSLKQAADGSVELPAFDATVHGQTAQYESGGGKDNIGYWTNADDYVTWDFKLERGDKFGVEITFACAPGSGESEYVVSVAGKELAGRVRETGSWTQFVTEKLGTVEISEPGRYTLTVKPKTKPNLAVMNLKAVKLVPAK